MRKACDVLLNGVALSTVCPELVLSDVKHTAPTVTRQWNTLAQRDNMVLSGTQRSGCKVTVEFYLPIREYEIRQAYCQRIISWARNGGVLTCHDRPGQQLNVVCDQLPMISSVKNITELLSVTFGAYVQPFWQEATPAKLSLASGTSGSGNLYVPGNVGKVPVEVTVTPADSMANVALTVGDTTITLTGVAATSSAPVTITYDENMIQSIKRGTVSVLDKRTGADDLLAVCGGISACSFTASAAASVVFSARGVWA